MKFNNFKVKRKRRNVLIVGGIVLILLVSAILIYRSYAIYEENQNFSVIKGNVPDQNYDVLVSFVVNGEESNVMPEGRDWKVQVTCNKGALGEWNYDSWSLITSNILESRTKCKLSFDEYVSPLHAHGIHERVVTSGSGLYEVDHSDAVITVNVSEEQKNNLKQTEYRYAGSNPKNYVKFNNELWRIIGLVNTPDGSHLKLVRNESIGMFSWDSSGSFINNGFGVNEWKSSDLMALLNSGAYYNRISGDCYKGYNNAMVSCDFSSTGLTQTAKEKIYSSLWLYGSNDEDNLDNNQNGLTKHFYNYERSNNMGKNCSSGNLCNDDVERSFAWRGEVGLISPSDYGYATSGDKNREYCLNQVLKNMKYSSLPSCTINNWLLRGGNQWFMIPFRYTVSSAYVFYLNSSGYVNVDIVASPNWVFPSVFLKNDVIIESGEGTFDNPYVI